ncbi:hypothetical protein ARMGADRAFT_1028466 [Armillaria gallica]|uniref:Uncharacterized protein n=1 Tax=Armillaria gallica TaxID=47427 RepID=A0A2H3DLS4_ARMGA|nr:hypothetical protein ARMGADRAFT_1028466 [Armillaria gallica]
MLSTVMLHASRSTDDYNTDSTQEWALRCIFTCMRPFILGVALGRSVRILSDITTIPGAFICLARAVFSVNRMHVLLCFQVMPPSYPPLQNASAGPPVRAALIHQKRILYHISRHFLWRNVTVIFGTNQKSTLNLLSFDSERLAAIRSISIIVDGSFDVCPSSFTPVLASMSNVNYVRVSGASGAFIRLILENTMATLVTLELDDCYAEPQDFSEMIPIAIRDLRISTCHSNMRFLLGPLQVEDLEVHGAERPLTSLKELVLDIPLSQDMHQKLLELIPAFPMLKESRIGY